MLRSGTNYFSTLLERNFHVRQLTSLDAGWKHGPISPRSDVIPLLLVRNPYAWIEAFYNWERINDRTDATLDTFVSSPVTHPQLRDTWAAKDPVDAWNKALSSWLATTSASGYLMFRYEDLLTGVSAELERFEARYEVERRHPELTDIVDRVDTWPTPQPRGELRRGSSALNENLLPPSVLDTLNERLDPEVMATLGYPLRR
jgi:hypothetical protein